MASKEFELLAPFGTDESEKWFRNAYKWTRDEVSNMGGNIASGVSAIRNFHRQGYLIQANKLRDLRVDGKGHQGPGRWPSGCK